MKSIKTLFLLLGFTSLVMSDVLATPLTSSSPNWRAEGDDIGQLLGYSITSLGDMNGDGFTEFAVGGPHMYEHAQKSIAKVYSLNSVDGNGLPEPIWSDSDPVTSFGPWGSFYANQYGTSVHGVDVNNDSIKDLLVGVPLYVDPSNCPVLNLSCTKPGAVFVYVAQEGAVPGNYVLPDEPTQILVPNDPNGGSFHSSEFGFSITSADIDGDASPEIVIAAPRFRAAYVYDTQASATDPINPVSIQSIIGPAGSSNLYAIDMTKGDINNDGREDILLGDGNANSRSGAAYLYYADAATGLLDTSNPWVFHGQPTGSDLAGNALSVLGDVNGDNVDDIAIASYGHGHLDMGRVSIFHGINGSPLLGSSASPAVSEDADKVYIGSDTNLGFFGTSISNKIDINGDGYLDLIISGIKLGTHFATANIYLGSAQGLADDPAWTEESNEWVHTYYPFGINTSGPTQTPSYLLENIGDFNNDGTDDLLMGANWYINNIDAQGMVQIYYGTDSLTAGFDEPTGAVVLSHNYNDDFDPNELQRYSTAGATASSYDTHTCMAAQHSVWFKFRATSEEVEIALRTAGNEGTLGYGKVTLYKDTLDPNYPNRLEAIDCHRYTNLHSDVGLAYDNLTIDNWYYIAVDNVVNMAGTFTLHLSDTISNDFQEAAEPLVIADALGNPVDVSVTGSTLQASTDSFNGSCWASSANASVWYQFESDGSFPVTVTVDTAGLANPLYLPRVSVIDPQDQETCGLGLHNLQLEIDTATGGAGTYYIVIANHPQSEGNFTLNIESAGNYDQLEFAQQINFINGDYVSLDKEFSTVGATADGPTSECRSYAANQNNVWFKFQQSQLSGTEVEIQLLTGGFRGDLSLAYLSLWEELADGSLDEIACKRYHNSKSDLGIALNDLDDLDPTKTYYISVDNIINNQGDFTLAVSDTISSDFHLGAEVINNISSGCLSQRTTEGATLDHFSGSCWDTQTNDTLWFKFTADESERIKATVAAASGTIFLPRMALVDGDDPSVEWDCDRSYPDAIIDNNNLIDGKDYYLVVANLGVFSGTFDLCFE